MVGSPTETVDRGNWVVLVDGDVTLPTGTIPSEVAQAKLGYPATRKENLYWTYIHDLSYILYLISYMYIYISLYIYLGVQFRFKIGPRFHHIQKDKKSQRDG